MSNLDDEIGRVIGADLIGSGIATLNGIASIPVSCPGITATSKILFSIREPLGTVSIVWPSSVTPGTGFSLTSLALNTSTVSWVVIT